MKWGLKDDSTFGVINPPPAELIYLSQHNELVGLTWQNHLKEFAEYVSERISGAVLEIGAGHCRLSQEIYKLKSGAFERWDILEPNPLIAENPYGVLISDYFPTVKIAKKNYDAIVHSHVLEHVTSPIDFLIECHDTLNDNGEIFMSVPNMENMASNIDLNLLMFEHLTYLTHKEIENISNFAGFQIIDFYNYKKHSIFLHLKKRTEFSKSRKVFKSLISNAEITQLVKNYSTEIIDKVSHINRFLAKNELTFYLFGAHIFSQYLISLGLNTKMIVGLLDNSTYKQGKRLYGTNLTVTSPDHLKGKEYLGIVLPMGNYEDEIIQQLLDLGIKHSMIYSLRTGLKNVF
jgi:2-polyprenyl-3-methyl-5-hydroxy-6-metoxy-1,4-benzoquinol methylase